MPCELKEGFISEKSPQEINKTLLEIIRIKNGKILSCSQDFIKARFGSMLMARLFGVWFFIAFHLQLPFVLEVRIVNQNRKTIEVCMIDNMGKIFFRDSWIKSAYTKYFYEIFKEIKGKL